MNLNLVLKDIQIEERNYLKKDKKGATTVVARTHKVNYCERCKEYLWSLPKGSILYPLQLIKSIDFMQHDNKMYFFSYLTMDSHFLYK